MSKKLLIIGVAVILAVGGGIAYLLLGGKPEMPPKTQTPENNAPAAAPQEPNAQPVVPGVYTDYSDQAFADAQGTRILFFHAAWCPQCRALESDIKAKGVPGGVTILKINYDTATSLRQKYGVALQTTLVKVDAQGNLVSKFVAYDEPTLEAVVKNLL